MTSIDTTNAGRDIRPRAPTPETAHQGAVYSAHDGLASSLLGRIVILGINESLACTAAIHVAHRLATELGAVIRVIHVLDDRTPPIPPPLDTALGLADGVVGSAVHEQQISELSARISDTLGEPVDWKPQVRVGNPSAVITHYAAEQDAALIVVGLRRHSRVDRALHDESTLNVIRSATVPVLAVAAGCTSLPRTVLAAFDFSPHSLAAARVARILIPPGGRLHLVHVPTVFRYSRDDGEGIVHELGVAAALAEAEHIVAGGGVTIDHAILRRELRERTPEMILDYATSINAQLISAGSVGRSMIDRLIIGSVSMDLVRDGRHSLLIVPDVKRESSPR